MDSLKQKSLVAKIEQNKNDLENTESAISKLKKSNTQYVSFELRKGYFAKHNAAYLMFPNTGSRAVPSKSNRNMIHLILSSLEIDESKVLSDENINQPEQDLSAVYFDNGKFSWTIL